MSLSQHIDAHRMYASPGSRPSHGLHQTWKRVEDAANTPRYTMPKVGINAQAAYQLLHDETALDGNPLLNVASFIHTWMPEQANKLIMENINKSIVELDEYPAASLIHNRCVSMLADLWKAPNHGNVIGTATVGSSEGVMLGGLAMKKRWQEGRKAAAKDHFHPNIVFGSNAQVALEKFARYFDVETRLVPVKEEHGFVMNPPDALPFIDENTIGVIVILGSTYTGHFEDVKLMSDLLDDLKGRTGLDIPIHVDAATGGFIAPFAHPNLKWSFDVPRVVSINASGHKFGLVYPGLGWVLWRDKSYLHRDLNFELHYLGGTQYSFTLNFSKPAGPIIAQMFNFLNFGFDGYKKMACEGLRNARMLSRALDSTYFKVLSNIHCPIVVKKPYNGSHSDQDSVDNDNPEHFIAGPPVVAFRLSDEYKKDNPHVQQGWIQTLLRAKGWIIPNYPAPLGAEKVEILRIVVRPTLSEDLIEHLITDILAIAESLTTLDGNLLAAVQALKVPNQPDHDDARLKKENTGDEPVKPSPANEYRKGRSYA